jgi:hypothetical protein
MNEVLESYIATTSSPKRAERLRSEDRAPCVLRMSPGRFEYPRLPQVPSMEELVTDWNLSGEQHTFISPFRAENRTWLALNLCFLRKRGRLLAVEEAVLIWNTVEYDRIVHELKSSGLCCGRGTPPAHLPAGFSAHRDQRALRVL